MIRAWSKESVRWDPRGPGDRRPWESYDVRYSARECHPENPDGSPWTGPQDNDHGREERGMSARYEVGTAGDIPVHVVRPGGAEADDLELQPGEFSLVIGDPGSSAYAVNGTPDELQSFVTRLSRALRNLPN